MTFDELYKPGNLVVTKVPILKDYYGAIDCKTTLRVVASKSDINSTSKGMCSFETLDGKVKSAYVFMDLEAAYKL
jgi:hypothetical protein